MTRYKMLLMALFLGATLSQAQNYYKIGEQVSLFNEVCRRLNAMYVDSLDAEQMISDAIEGMTSRLDPFTEFYTSKDKEKLEQLITGKYAGIGAIVKYCQDKKHVCIDYPFENTPAREAGLEKGDVILSINDTAMTDTTTAYVSSHLRGEPGTSMQVKIRKRSSGKEMVKTITRRTIQRPEVACSFAYDTPKGRVGVIALTEFTVGCYSKVREAYLDLKEQGIEKLVFDLRGNTGGSVLEAADITNMFIPRGELIVQTLGKTRELNRQYYAEKDPVAPDIPLIVLVDEESASASEILAGCLQDLDRAKIIGTKTYGKGIVQQTAQLSQDAEIKITVSRYYLPSGRCVQARNYKKGVEESVADSLKHTFYTRGGREVVDGSGIIPDIEVKRDTMPRILYYLSVGDSLELVHNYVCEYLNAHPKIDAPLSFSLSDKDYADFKQRVVKANFSYDPFTERTLKQLKEVAEVEGYYENSKEEFAALEKKLSHNVDFDLDFRKPKVKAFLEYEIILGHYGYHQAVSHGYLTDKIFLRALEEF